MAKAKAVTAAAVYASCGKCGEELTNKEGSFMLDVAQTGPAYTCASCGTVNTLPKTAKIA